MIHVADGLPPGSRVPTKSAEAKLLRHTQIPVVPHKAVAEVSKIGNYRRGWLH